MAHIPVTVMPCSLHSIAVVTNALDNSSCFHPELGYGGGVVRATTGKWGREIY